MTAASTQGTRRRFGGRSSTGVALRVEASLTLRSAKPRSWAVRNRCSGDFSVQRCTMRSTNAGTRSSDAERSGRSSLRIALMLSAAEPRSKAASPDSISHSTVPKEKMSDRASVSSPRTCSGAM
jgi:hypothetical protein